jgi:predicted DNA-binding protein with PD1-like motif
MKEKLLGGSGGVRRFVAVFERGEDVLPSLLGWARERRMTAASFVGIGAFRRVELGFFDPGAGDYVRSRIDEQVEVLSLAGNIGIADGEPKVHAHVVVGKSDASAYGGHLLAAEVGPTLELVVTESEAIMRRTFDAATGLPLLDPDA